MELHEMYKKELEKHLKNNRIIMSPFCSKLELLQITVFVLSFIGFLFLFGFFSLALFDLSVKSGIFSIILSLVMSIIIYINILFTEQKNTFFIYRNRNRLKKYNIEHIYLNMFSLETIVKHLSENNIKYHVDVVKEKIYDDCILKDYYVLTLNDSNIDKRIFFESEYFLCKYIEMNGEEITMRSIISKYKSEINHSIQDNNQNYKMKKKAQELNKTMKL